ncbi:MAG: galactokinase, partial [Pseudomonadota bacterium]
LALVIIDSGIRRELTTSALNARRHECEAAARRIGVKALRDVSAQALTRKSDRLDRVLMRRARHVVSEIARVEPTAVALAHGDTAALSRLMRASHLSLRNDFEVTVPEVDRLVDIVWAALGEGDDALGGVRMTGAGFGGSVVAVLHKSAAERVFEAVQTQYNPTARIPATADIYSMVGGASEVTPP